MSVKVEEGYRLQATGYRELFVYLYGYVYEKRKSYIGPHPKVFFEV